MNYRYLYDPQNGMDIYEKYFDENANDIISNWALFHLQRHSDHHANATRSYQSLRHFPDLPSLPNGYFGMFIMAYIPWLWFYVMDKRLISVTNGDFDSLNLLDCVPYDTLT